MKIGFHPSMPGVRVVVRLRSRFFSVNPYTYSSPTGGERHDCSKNIIKIGLCVAHGGEYVGWEIKNKPAKTDSNLFNRINFYFLLFNEVAFI